MDEYIKILKSYFKRFTWHRHKNVVYFTDKYNSDIQFAMYVNDDILTKTKSG